MTTYREIIVCDLKHYMYALFKILDNTCICFVGQYIYIVY